MADRESIDIRLARIEEHIKNIEAQLEKKYICCRHVTPEGDCDFYNDVMLHDRKINQWTGAISAVALLCSMIGSVIGVILAKLTK